MTTPEPNDLDDAARLADGTTPADHAGHGCSADPDAAPPPLEVEPRDGQVDEDDEHDVFLTRPGLDLVAGPQDEGPADA